MFILKFLPDWIFYAILIGGGLGLGASFLLKFVPFVAQYRAVIQTVSGIMIGVGLYMSGAISDNNAWKQRVADLEVAVAKAEAASAQANSDLQTKIAGAKQQNAAHTAQVQTRVQSYAVQMDSVCRVDSTVIGILNDAARGPQGDKK